MEKLFSHTHCVVLPAVPDSSAEMVFQCCGSEEYQNAVPVSLKLRRTFTLPVGSRACEAVEYIEHMARTGVISYHEVWDRVYDVVANHYFNLNVSIRGV